MNPTRPRFFVPVGLVLLTTGVLGATLAQVGCAPEPPPADPDPSQATRDGDPEIDPETQDTIAEIFGTGADDPLPPAPGDWPVLEFEPTAEALPTEGTWRERPLLHDFDGDGFADLVASNREEDGLNIWKSPGPEGGAYALKIDGVPRDLMYGGSDAADLNGDGHQDLVFVAHGEGLTTFMGDGQFGWTQGDPLENPFLMLDVALGDLDGDGKHDAVGVGQFEGGIGAYLGDGEGHFRRLPQSNQILSRSRFGTRVELVDMDSDGLDDIIVTAEKGATVLFTRREEETGELSWENASEGLPRPEIGNSLRGVVVGDFDGDGQHEVVVGALANPGVPEDERLNLGLFRWNGEQWEQADAGLPRQLSTEDLEIGDFDQDGKLDIVVVAGQIGVLLYRGNGDLSFTCSGLLPDSWMADKVALGDANGDGWLDIAVLSSDTKYNRSAGGLTVWLNSEGLWGR